MQLFCLNWDKEIRPEISNFTVTERRFRIEEAQETNLKMCSARKKP